MQECTMETPTRTMGMILSSGGSGNGCYHHDRHEHLNIDSSLRSTGCSSSSSSSRSTTPEEVAMACPSHLHGFDFSAFGFSASGSGGGRRTSGGGRSTSGSSSAHTETEPPSSDTSSCYGFPKECIDTESALAATVDASRGVSPSSLACDECGALDLSDGRGIHLRGSRSDATVPAGSANSSDRAMARVAAREIGGNFAALSSVALPPASWGPGRKDLDSGSTPAVENGSPHRLWPSSSSQRVDHEDGGNHDNDIRRAGDVEALGRGARRPVSMRILRNGGFADWGKHPEISTAKRARCTRLPRGDYAIDKPWDGKEKCGKGGATERKDTGKNNDSGKTIESTDNNHRINGKRSGTPPLDGMDDDSFPVFQTPSMLRTSKTQSWTSSTNRRTGGGAAGGNSAAPSGCPSDMCDMMKSFGDITLSCHSELPSASSRARVLLRTRAVRAIQSFPDVVTCFRDGAAMHEEDEDIMRREGRSLSDSAVPMDQARSVRRRGESKAGGGGGGLRGAGHPRITGEKLCNKRNGKRGAGRSAGSSRSDFGHDDVCGGGGDTPNSSVAVGAKAAAWLGSSDQEGGSGTGGEEFERWIRCDSSTSTSTSSCSTSTSNDAVEVWRENGGRRTPRPVTQATRSEDTPQSRKHRLN